MTKYRPQDFENFRAFHRRGNGKSYAYASPLQRGEARNYSKSQSLYRGENSEFFRVQKLLQRGLSPELIQEGGPKTSLEMESWKLFSKSRCFYRGGRARNYSKSQSLYEVVRVRNFSKSQSLYRGGSGKIKKYEGKMQKYEGKMKKYEGNMKEYVENMKEI